MSCFTILLKSPRRPHCKQTRRKMREESNWQTSPRGLRTSQNTRAGRRESCADKGRQGVAWTPCLFFPLAQKAKVWHWEDGPSAPELNEFGPKHSSKVLCLQVQGASACICEFQWGWEAFIKIQDPAEPRRPQAKERKWWKQLKNLSRNGRRREGHNYSPDHIRYLLQIVMQDSNCLLGGQEANGAGLASNRFQQQSTLINSAYCETRVFSFSSRPLPTLLL